MLSNKLRIGISASVPAIMALPVTGITLGYAIHLSGSGIGGSSAIRIKYQCL